MSQTAIAPTDEAESVLAWRELSLTDAGVQPDTAHRLAECPADLHAMVDSAKCGATSEQLLRIYL